MSLLYFFCLTSEENKLMRAQSNGVTEVNAKVRLQCMGSLHMRIICKLLASNEVIVQLIKTKCFPVLYYGLEACPLCEVKYSSIMPIIRTAR